MRVSHAACPLIHPRRSPDVLASVMERHRLLEHLSSAKWHVEEGESQIAAQKRIISDLLAAKSDTTEADTVLRMFELAQSGLIMDVEKILDALDKLPLFEDDGQS
jgi:hypothetical protein